MVSPVEQMPPLVEQQRPDVHGGKGLEDEGFPIRKWVRGAAGLGTGTGVIKRSRPACIFLKVS